MHEHVFVEYGGPSAEALKPGRARAEIISVCTGYLEKLRAFGVETLVDPTTVDLGRNATLLAELAGKTGFNIICATGIYSTATYVRCASALATALRQ